MSVISVSLPSDGTTADVSDYNTPITTMVNDYNGNIDNSNIASAAAIAGSKLANASVSSAQVDFGGSGAGIWWEEVGRTTLSGAADTITVSSFAARKHLRVFVYGIATGGTISAAVTLNSDTGSRYAQRSATNDSADASSTSATSFGIFPATAAYPQYSTMEIINIATQEKLIIVQSMTQNTAGAGNLPARYYAATKWANTTDQITTITVTNAGTGDYASGSEVIVLGHD